MTRWCSALASLCITHLPASTSNPPPFRLATRPGESEVPFGRSKPRFFVNFVGAGNARGFRYEVEAKRNGGGGFASAVLLRAT